MAAITNVDRFEVAREGDEIVLKFMDIFGDGAAFGLPVKDAKKVRDALTRVIGDER